MIVFLNISYGRKHAADVIYDVSLNKSSSPLALKV